MAISIAAIVVVAIVFLYIDNAITASKSEANVKRALSDLLGSQVQTYESLGELDVIRLSSEGNTLFVGCKYEIFRDPRCQILQ
ncbi:MAG: hypothetical protein HY426_05185 [Candidatus Levybacteria bacterium]|nr:hypothetical protein [Candidatus Levybacteria bacterium]